VVPEDRARPRRISWMGRTIVATVIIVIISSIRRIRRRRSTVVGRRKEQRAWMLIRRILWNFLKTGL
jgi:type VI protein secretion system component VasA